MKTMPGLRFQRRYSEHMGCIQGCLQYLGADVSDPWLYGGSTHAFVLNMNDTVFVDAAQAWDTAALYPLYPNLGFRREGLVHDFGAIGDPSSEIFRQKQREAWDFIRDRVDRGIPCYAWELDVVPMWYVVTGYDEVGYYFSSYRDGGPCPWEKMATFDVHVVAVHAIERCEAAPPDVTVRDALASVLARVEQADGWALGPRYRTGLPAYEMWAQALEAGRAVLDGQGYLNHYWLECREMAVAFLQEAKERLPGRCDAALDEAATHYGAVCEALRALLTLHPERPERECDWTTALRSAAGAALVRQAAQAEARGVACLRRVWAALA